MKNVHWLLGAVITGALASSGVAAQPVLMSEQWATAACAAWNNDPVLTDQLAESGWAQNDKGRGFKVMQLFRSDCGAKPSAEMRIARKDGKALCVYGGRVETAQLDLGADYVMSAETARWTEMGNGDYGPMRAMMFGRLHFQGPKMEAMSNMTPFENFLRLVGKVPGSTASCPTP
jgi:putative sterol carrier protein